MVSDPIRSKIADLQEELVAVRHDFHMHPELGFEEVRTARIVAEKLRSWGLSPTEGVARTGVVCLIEGTASGRTIALRADMDALPIEEESDLPYRSHIPGKMHACGHDGHTTILLGAAAVLRQLRTQFYGTVKLIFQPSEEAVSGAVEMVREGVLKNPTVDAALALHGWPGIPLGKVGIKSGAMMASSDAFDIRVLGKGGHAAYPARCVDPIYIASLIIQALQGTVSRETSLDEPAVLTFTRLEAGTAYNVIPETTRVSGTVRALSEMTRARMMRRIPEIATAVAQSYGGAAEFKALPGCPVTHNDERITSLVEEVARRAIGANVVTIPHPSMGAEDFSAFTQAVPAMMFFLGLGDVPMCHNPRFDFDDRAIPIGIEIFVKATLAFLSEGLPDSTPLRG